MNKVIYELIGNIYPIEGQDDHLEFRTREVFENLEDATKFGEANMESYVVYMRLKIAEKKNEQ